MPELPELETTRRGIAPFVEGSLVSAVCVREPRLRWPVPAEIGNGMVGTRIETVQRRGKYLLLRTNDGTALIHLGMSGSLRLARTGETPGKHDHFDIILDSGDVLRFNDPRRFGAFLWTDRDPAGHPLLRNLGPEPLGDGFHGAYLHRVSRGRRIAIKPHLMNAGTVVGVGNIYANEALFQAGIHPSRAAGRISLERMTRLADRVKNVLMESIRVGGTTLRDFRGGDGKPGYFRQRLEVYGRAGMPCRVCKTPVRQIVLGQRSTFYCVNCQH